MASLILSNLVKRYGVTEVLHGIDLAVADGAIEIGGRDVSHLESKERDIAMVFQNYAIYPHMSVKKNIAFGLRSSKMAKADKERRIAEVAEILDMMPLLDRKPRNFRARHGARSGGFPVR